MSGGSEAEYLDIETKKIVQMLSINNGHVKLPKGAVLLKGKKVWKVLRVKTWEIHSGGLGPEQSLLDECHEHIITEITHAEYMAGGGDF